MAKQPDARALLSMSTSAVAAAARGLLYSLHPPCKIKLLPAFPDGFAAEVSIRR